jgi:hypothetical protein
MLVDEFRVAGLDLTGFTRPESFWIALDEGNEFVNNDDEGICEPEELLPPPAQHFRSRRL